MSTTIATKAANDAGAAPRRRTILTIGEQDEARRLWARGLGTVEIADILGVPEAVVYNGLAPPPATTHGDAS